MKRERHISGLQHFDGIYASHYEAVLRYCLRRSRREDALDATAETFTVAWRRSGDIPKGKELPWLYGVARRVLANQRRSAGRQLATVAHLESAPARSSSEPEGQMLRNEENHEVVAALGRLTFADRELIRLAGWEELDRHEMAVALGCTPNAVTKRLNRALDHLAQEMGVAVRASGGFFRRRVVAE